ncbi:unnamed protein product [Sphenostylis stenocarpa]|uniref:Uncharacterized protein n=1 Tax=Sphenostylis stenocarpa TaxID=92480 RepID=A0AA86SUF0_9FABA|nr:unnamed protein product [Sphenostylis stenocarpa]
MSKIYEEGTHWPYTKLVKVGLLEGGCFPEIWVWREYMLHAEAIDDELHDLNTYIGSKEDRSPQVSPKMKGRGRYLRTS